MHEDYLQRRKSPVEYRAEDSLSLGKRVTAMPARGDVRLPYFRGTGLLLLATCILQQLIR